MRKNNNFAKIIIILRNFNNYFCEKQFNKKDDYIKHTEKRKKPCKTKYKDILELENYPILSKDNIILDKNDIKLSQFIQNEENNILIEYKKLFKEIQNDNYNDNDNNINDVNCNDINSNDSDSLNSISNKKNHLNQINLDDSNPTKCNYCLKIFSNIYNLKKHQSGHCKVKKLDEEKKEEIFNKLIEREEKFEILLNNFENLQKYTLGLKNQNETLQNQITELEKKFKEQMKEQTKSYDNKIKQIITKNVNNNSNNTINNINKTYVNFYNSIDYKVLSKKEIMNILDKCCNSIEESIKTIHFNKKLPEYNNIFITNLKDNIAYIFDGTQFSAVLKNEAIDELMTSHLEEIESSVKEYENKLSDIKLKYINKFLDTINNEEEKYSYDNKKFYPNYKNYKSELIKNLIYNYSDSKLLEKLKTLNLNNKIQNDSDSEAYINNKIDQYI